MRRFVVYAFIVFLALANAGPASGDLIYSGLQNILLQGVPNSVQTLTLDLASDAGTWDNLQLEISEIGLGGGTNTIYPGAEVALASTPGSFPLVTRFTLGDPFPSTPLFGSGGETLWGFGTGPADGSFYSATRFGNFGGGPKYLGWVHLNVQNSSTDHAAITVIDWAYSDVVGQTVAIGETPEPSTFALTGSVLLIGLLFGTVRRRILSGPGVMTKFLERWGEH